MDNQKSEKTSEPIPETEFEGEKYIATPVAIDICKTHSKTNWQEHGFYIDNHDGTVSCEFCPFGAKLGGYFRVLDGKIVDLRSL